jgi:hypothetical protein
MPEGKRADCRSTVRCLVLFFTIDHLKVRAHQMFRAGISRSIPLYGWKVAGAAWGGRAGLPMPARQANRSYSSYVSLSRYFIVAYSGRP